MEEAYSLWGGRKRSVSRRMEGGRRGDGSSQRSSMIWVHFYLRDEASSVGGGFQIWKGNKLIKLSFGKIGLDPLCSIYPELLRMVVVKKN